MAMNNHEMTSLVETIDARNSVVIHGGMTVVSIVGIVEETMSVPVERITVAMTMVTVVMIVVMTVNVAAMSGEHPYLPKVRTLAAVALSVKRLVFLTRSIRTYRMWV